MSKIRKSLFTDVEALDESIFFIFIKNVCTLCVKRKTIDAVRK